MAGVVEAVKVVEVVGVTEVVGVVEVVKVFEVARVVEVVRVVEMVKLVEVIRVVEVVYKHEENLGVKGPKKKKKKDVGLPMTMPQAAGKNMLHFKNSKIFRKKLKLFGKNSSILASKLNDMVVAHYN